MAIKISPADKAFSECVRAAAGECERCGKGGRLECSHIFSRANRTIRWAKDNAMAKCFMCHKWWHAEPTESGVWFRGLKGDGFVALLIEKKNNKFKVPKTEEKDIARHYRGQLKIIEQKRSEGHTGFIDFVSWQ
ncbi:MAG: hypothetical protein RPR40_12815 [Bermanella sp.]